MSIINYAPQLEPEGHNDVDQRSNYLSKRLLLFLETMCIHAFVKCFLASQKHALTFLIVGDSISASRRVCLLANLGDLRGVDAIFNKGVDTRGF